MFEVEKNVEVPQILRDQERPRKYPFNEMDVGDSFFIPSGTHAAENINGKTTPRVSSAAHNYGKIHGQKFTIRKQPCGGYRVWRIE